MQKNKLKSHICSLCATNNVLHSYIHIKVKFSQWNMVGKLFVKWIHSPAMITHNQSTWIFKCFLSDCSLLNHKCIFVSVIVLNIEVKIEFSDQKNCHFSPQKAVIEAYYCFTNACLKFPQNMLLKYAERTKKTLILKIYAVKFEWICI